MRLSNGPRNRLNLSGMSRGCPILDFAFFAKFSGNFHRSFGLGFDLPFP